MGGMITGGPTLKKNNKTATVCPLIFIGYSVIIILINERVSMKKYKIDISTKWESQLPQYAQLYSNLNEQGKKEMLKQLTVIGKLIDRMQTMRKENNDS